jgi:hypothetical protein
MGHWHLASRDVQANKKIFFAMGGTPLTGGNEAVQFPGVRVNLPLGNALGSGEKVGSVVNQGVPCCPATTTGWIRLSS